MNEAEVRVLYEQYFYYIVAAGIVIGFILGLIPLIIGIRRGKRAFGMIGLVVSTVIGAFSPLLAVVAAVIFTFLVTRGNKAVQAENDPEN